MITHITSRFIEITKSMILMLKAPHLLAGGGQLGVLLAVTAVILSQYIPPSDPPPRRQTSFTGQSQTVATLPQTNLLFER